MPEPDRRGHLRRGVSRARPPHECDRGAEAAEDGEGEGGLPDHEPARDQHAAQGAAREHRERARDRRRRLDGQDLHCNGVRRARPPLAHGEHEEAIRDRCAVLCCTLLPTAL